MSGADDQRCSFCDKSQNEVEVLIAGPCNDLYICDECVSLCQGIVDYYRNPPPNK